ncbi:helix-turn-helix domain-containing protein [Chryseobacterium antibioticum]|uniref:Helix-turn-helix domain-containing protein n=1 Tax=Chryseobacterium pyrolae TaxID=2987481 RepID=A0ABT2IMS4_9FLAO|nr:helix-turn-helix domain-containing protein [Chryseobacterium pyrolae]MCT2409950.1 helix-turn-helix domain-containing protein [Chryseobacterium pyrolae]
MPDFKLIYTDIINEKFPEKINDPLIRNKLNALNTAVDVLKFNILVFGESEYPILFKNQRLRSYDEASIREILNYQSKNKLTNTETGNHFKISRNTIARWRSFFKS